MNERGPMLVEIDRPSPPPPLESSRKPVSFRAVLFGLCGVCFINLITPFNDYVLSNASLVGGHLATGPMLLAVAVVMLVNGPLSRLAPRYVFTRGELSVALAMMLVGCSVPSIGLMRYLPGHLTAFWMHSSIDSDSRDLMRILHLPDWLFPKFTHTDPAQRGIEPVIQQFYQSAGQRNPTAWQRIMAVPWAAWAVPAFTWGILVMAMFGALMLLAVLFRRQWVEHERLPFPLAGLYVSLIEPPQPGRWVNDLLRRPAFWITVGSVFCIRGIGALHQYWPHDVPALQLHFDLTNILTDTPLRDAEGDFKIQDISVTIIALVFLIRSDLAFSAWFIFLLVQLERIAYARSQSTFTDDMADDQMFGAIVPFAVSLLFVGRHHLMMVVRQMFRGHRGNEPRESYLPYAAVGWGLLACIAVMVLWLCAAGASVIGAVLIVVLLMLVFLVLMRIIAETGFLRVYTPIWLDRPWIYLAQDVPQALTARTTLPSFFLANMFYSMFLHDTTESLPGFAPNAIRIGDSGAGLDDVRRSRQSKAMFAWLMISLLLAYVIGGGSTLWIHYNYPNTLDPKHEPIVNWGANREPKLKVIDTTVAYEPPGTGPQYGHNHLGHFAAGAVISTVLSVLRLRLVNWPLHPLGYLLVYTYGLQHIWFSVLLGWLAKKVVVRLGGAGGLRAVRPVVIGMILGDCGTGAFWLCVNFTLAVMGRQYHPV